MYRHTSDGPSEEEWDEEDSAKQAQQQQQPRWVPWQRDQKQDRDCTMSVDLRLAQTYVPAFTCLLRCSVLIILLSRPWACYSLPLHACLGAAIYVDRVARSEVSKAGPCVLCIPSGALLCFLCSPSVAASAPCPYCLSLAGGR